MADGEPDNRPAAARSRHSRKSMGQRSGRSPTLGYVDATHQTLRSQVDRTVWTFYWALAEGSPAANRALLLQKDWRYWSEAILSDLERVHPISGAAFRASISCAWDTPWPDRCGIDLRLSAARAGAGRSGLVFANSDLSGFSIFEEAQFRGVEAADKILNRLGRS